MLYNTFMENYSHFLEVAKEAAQLAERIIMKHYLGKLEVHLKADQSPVTVADQEAEKVIKSTIKKHFPTHSFLGEETGQTSDQSEYVWIVDPIDGTKNYTRGIPLFATLVALMHKGKIVVGLSNAPAIREMYTAYKGGGTYFNNEKVSVSTISDLSKAYLSFGSVKLFTKHKKESDLIALLRNSYTARGFGDAWSYHLLAKGIIDAMIEADTKIWDIAAVSLIIEEAGGKVTDIEGNLLSEKTTSLVATNGHIHDQVLSYFKK